MLALKAGEGTMLVPIVVKIQRLQARLRDDPSAFASSWNWVDAWLLAELRL